MAREEEKAKARGISASTVSTALNAAAVLPLAIGAGITSHNIYKTRNKVLGDLFGNTTGSTTGEYQDLLSHLKSGSSSQSLQSLGERISNLASRPIERENVLSAWHNSLRAISNTDRAAILRNEMIAFNPSTRTSAELIDFVSSKFKNSSIELRRAGTRFLSNVSAMQRGLTANQPLVALPKFQSYTMRGTRRIKDSFISNRIASFEKELGASTSVVARMRQGIAGHTLGINFKLRNALNLRLHIPTTIRGTGTIQYFGTETSSKYIAGSFGILEGNRIISTLKYEEWAMLKAESTLIPKIRALKDPTQQEINALAREFHNEIRKPLEYIHSGPRGTPNDIYEQYRQSILHLSDTSGQMLSEKDTKEFIRAGQMSFPGVTSPISGKPIQLFPFSPNTVSHGGFMTIDPRGFTAMSEAAPFGRRPGQALRAWGPTPTALRLAQQEGSLAQRYRGFAGGLFSGEPFRSTAGRTMYTSAPISAMEEGIFYINEAINARLGVQGLTNINLRIGENISVNPLLRDRLEETAPGVYGLKAGASPLVPAGTFLGTSPEGDAITTPHNINLLGAEVFGEKMKLQAMEIPDLGQASKYFQDIKGIGVRISSNEMIRQSGQAADLFAHMSDLKKNRSLHLKQMITGLSEINQENMNSFSRGVFGSALQSQHDLLRAQFDPDELLSTMKGLSSEQQIPHLISTAKQLGVSPRQAGLVFGAVPFTHGIETAEGLSGFGFEESWLPEIMKGRALGVAHIASAGPVELTGAGTAMASIEPRVFDAIRAGHFGEMGDKIFTDLASRRLLTDPEAIFAKEEFGKSLDSLRGVSITPAEGARVLDVGDLNENLLDPRSSDWIGANQGSYINMKGIGGLKNIYVPGSQSIAQLAPFPTAEGKIIQTDVTHAYQNFFNTVVTAGKSGKTDEMLAASNALASILVRAHRATIIGDTGVARGSLLGSRFFTAVGRSPSNPDADIRRIGISEEYAHRLFGEMEEAGALRPDAEEYAASLSGMRERLFGNAKKGVAPGEIGSYFIRHPVIGQHSLQAVRLHIDQKLSGALVSIPTVKRMFVINGKAEKVNWSVMVAAGGDYDGDIAGAILADPRHEMELAEMTRAGTPYARAYESFAIRHQLMKVKAPPAASVEAAEASAAAMNMVLSHRIGEISFEMSKARAALVQQGGDPRKMENAMFMLEWFEQNPISGKHLTADQANQLDPLITDIVGAIREKKTTRLKSIFQSMTGFSEEKLAALSEDMVAEEAATGRKINLSGLKLDETLGTIQTALESFDTDAFQMTRSKSARFGVGEIGSYFDAFYGSSLSEIAGTRPGMMASFSRKTMSAMRGLASGIMENKKTLGLGIAGSLALASVMSSPSRSLGPTGAPQLQMNTNMGDSVQRENIHPHSPSLGQPTPPSMPRGPAPIARDTGMSAMIRVRGRASGNFNPSDLNHGVRGALGPGTSSSTRVSDDRSIMTANKLDDILSR